MGTVSEVKSVMQKVNGLNFYCEIRGSGPTVALVPSGEGDCGSFARVADMLADQFTVFTLDMRYMSRSERPADLKPITERDIASDVAGLLKALELAPASIYGCSSGGQCALTMGLDYPDVCRNLMIHEAALPDAAHPDAFESSFRVSIRDLAEKTGSRVAALNAMFSDMVGDANAWASLGVDYHERVDKNLELWADYMVGHVNLRTYSAEELSAMPPLVFSVGKQSTSPGVKNTVELAKQANAELVFLPCRHLPQVTIPELLAKHIREYTTKHL